MTDTRAAFERWFRDDFLDGMDTAGEWDAERNCYVTHQVHMAWKGWQAAINHERSECAKVCEEIEEPAWYGYENPNSFDDGSRAAAAAIRARSD